MKKHLGPIGLLFFIVIIAILASCKKDKSFPPFEGKEFFPLKVGSYVLYDVDSINFYDITLTSDTFRWQEKELVDSMYNDETGTPSYILFRYKRDNAGNAWSLDRIWSAKVNDAQAEKQEENLRFIKLSFPVLANKTWKGNAYLPDSTSIYTKDWSYDYTNVDTTILMNNTPLDSTIIVSQYDNENLVQKDIEKEMYTKHIGLTYKESTHVERQNITPNWKPEKGRIVIYRYNSRG